MTVAAAATVLFSFSTLFLVSILLTFPATTTSDNPCAYPCYPPPTAGGTTTPTTPTTTTPPSPPATQTGSYNPPPSVYNNPTGSNTYNPPPYSGYGSGNPPPDPILPYFPFYYKNGARGDKDASAAATSMIRKSSMLFNTMASTNLLIVFIFIFFL